MIRLRVSRGKNTHVVFAAALLVIALTIGFWLNYGSTANAFAGGGDGSSVDPYRVTTCSELQSINDDLSADYILDNDINCADSFNWNSGKGFDPIGDGTNAFTGDFNGQNHTISNLYINRADDDIADNGVLIDEHYVGLFGYTNNAAIQNFKLLTSKIKGFKDVGGVIGFMNSGTLNNVSVNTTTDNSSIGCTGPGAACVWARYGMHGGGLVGHQVGGTIDNSHVGGPVKGSGNVIGGLVGLMEGGASMSNATADSHIDGGSDLGGAVGHMKESIVTGVQASGDVYATSVEEANKPGFYAGGLVGSMEEFSSIIASRASGDVHTDSSEAGGLVGLASASMIEDSYATGAVEAGISFAGGLIGTIINGQISRNYATGAAHAADETAGGLIGRVFVGDGDTIANNFSTSEVSAANGRVGGFIGVYNTLSPNPSIEHNYYDAEKSELSYCTNLYDTPEYDLAGCEPVNIGNAQPSYFISPTNKPFSISDSQVWNESTWYFDGVTLPQHYTGYNNPRLVTPAPDSTIKAYRNLKVDVYTPGYGLSGSFKITLTPTAGGSAKVLTLSNMPTGMHFFDIDAANPASYFLMSSVAPAGPIENGTYDLTFSYIAEADGATLLSTQTAHNVVVADEQTMLCQEPYSTDTTASTACTNQPVEGWGATTWEARYRKATDSSYTLYALDDPTAGVQPVSLGELLPGSDYYVEYRYTNDGGTSPWWRVIVATTGTVPVVNASERKSGTSAPVSSSDKRIVVATTDDSIINTPTIIESLNDLSAPSEKIAEKKNKETNAMSAGFNFDWRWIFIVIGGVTVLLLVGRKILRKDI